jgi:hypothetical protein
MERRSADYDRCCFVQSGICDLRFLIHCEQFGRRRIHGRRVDQDTFAACVHYETFPGRV